MPKPRRPLVYRLKTERDEIFKKMQDFEKKTVEAFDKIEKTKPRLKPIMPHLSKNTEDHLPKFSDYTRVFKD